jgi:predicted HTH domain antitoxin
MQLILDDDLVNAARLTEEEARLTLAVSLYVQERLSLAYAAQFAGLDRLTFQRSLSARDIPLHYGQEELGADLATVRWLREGDTANR